LKWIHNGKEVQIFNEQNETIGLGRITRIAPFVDEGTQSVSVFVSIDRRENPNLFYGQYVKVSYNHFKIENVMRLPRSSVFNHDHVYIVQDSLLVKRNVTIVKNEEKMVLISGLPEGTMVVNEPLVDARENSLVRIINETKQ
jgi:multidrug efflux pump subunit AcrA (membrane-fusion protein)